MEQKNTALGKLRNMTSIYLTYQGKILLLYRQGSKVVNNLWVGSAGGHFEESELNDAYACIKRELYEELQVTEDMLENLSMRYITLRRTNGEIRQNYYFFAELINSENLSSNEGTLKWFSFDEVHDLEMPFTAKFVVEHWLEKGRYTEEIYGGVTNRDSVVFVELPES